MSNRIFLVALSLMVASSARASTSSCIDTGDGTACATTCVASGMCLAGDCIPITLRPDGTACTTESRCTTGDVCMVGICTVGSAVVCPDRDACERGYCSAAFGCALRNVCKPDLGMPPQPDMAGITDGGINPPNDLGSDDMSATSTDGGDIPDLSGVPNDMCVAPLGAEFYTCTGPDGFYYIPFDAATSDAAEAFHVRGSRPGDCSYGGTGGGSGTRTWPAASVIALLFASVVSMLRRARR